MGIFKDSLKIINEVVTLGGASRLEAARNAHDEAYGRYRVLYEKASGCKGEIEREVAAIGDALIGTKACLEKAEAVIARSVSDKSDLDVKFKTQTLNKVSQFNCQFNAALRLGVGSLAGGGLAVGSWAVVAAFGSASTGAAISGLSGIAATNATLAWFGGGALAAGGAGMAGGMAVLGGIVAIPLVYFAASGSHKKAKELEEAKVKIEQAIPALQEQVAVLLPLLEVVRTRRQVIIHLCNRFCTDANGLVRQIRPAGLLSAVKQRLLLLLGKRPYTRAQEDALDKLSTAVSEFIAQFRDSADVAGKVGSSPTEAVDDRVPSIQIIATS